MIKRPACYSGGMSEVLVVTVGDHCAVDIRHIAYSFRDEDSVVPMGWEEEGSTSSGGMSPSLRFACGALKVTNYKPNLFPFCKNLWSLLCICKASFCTRPPSPSAPGWINIAVYGCELCAGQGYASSLLGNILASALALEMVVATNG